MNLYNIATMINHGSLTAVLVVITAEKEQEYETDGRKRMT